MFTPGDRVLDRYQIMRPIGVGGMAFVFKALQLDLGLEVALKVLRPAALLNHELVERFRREGRVMATVSSPHVLRVHEVAELSEGTPVIVTELLRGRDLLKEIRARDELSIADAVGYVVQACEGAAAVHRAGLVHRDLKPQNLFLTADYDGAARVKILDFGICKMVVPDDGLSTGALVGLGTPSYMSPEQIRSAKHTDLRSDIWSLGIILFELLTKRSPFPSQSTHEVLRAVLTSEPVALRALRPEAPEALEAVLRRALDKSPSARWQSAEALRDALVPFTRVEEPSRPTLDSVPPVELPEDASLATYRKAGLVTPLRERTSAHDDQPTSVFTSAGPMSSGSELETRHRSTRLWRRVRQDRVRRPRWALPALLTSCVLVGAFAVSLKGSPEAAPASARPSAPLQATRSVESHLGVGAASRPSPEQAEQNTPGFAGPPAMPMEKASAPQPEPHAPDSSILKASTSHPKKRGRLNPIAPAGPKPPAPTSAPAKAPEPTGRPVHL